MQFEQLGPYRIVKMLGRGGMGTVYEGVNVETDERAAIKVLSPQYAMAEGFRERFEAEIDSLKKLRHESIVRLYGYGEQDGILFFSMELVDGTNLEHELKSGRRFDWKEVTRIAIVVSRALKHAHDVGVIHRDIKPANLMIDAEGQAKLTDFGIARLFGGNQLTSASGVLGTVEYMSPEQADGRRVTDRCDQYSLGGVMYALLAGRPPFRAGSMAKMLQLQLYAAPEPVRRYVADVPAELERIIIQLLEKNPADRFPNMGVLARQMEAMEKALLRPAHDDFEVGSGQTFDHASANLPLGETIDAGDDYDRSDEFDVDLGDQDPAPPAASAWASINKPTELPASEALSLAEEDVAGSVPPTRFTTVEEEAQRERLRARQAAIGPMWWQLAGLLTGLVLLVLTGWYFIQPLSADALYEKIRIAAEDSGTQPLAAVDGRMQEFLERFGDDPRATVVASYREDVELFRMERRLRNRARRGRGSGGLAPIEQMVVDAMRVGEANPYEAVAKLNAIVDLYDGDDDEGATRSAGDEGRRLCLTLARRQIERLSAQVDEHALEHRKALEERLARAEAVRATDPARARKMWEAIVRLYGDRPWAADLVAQAQAGLAATAENSR